MFYYCIFGLKNDLEIYISLDHWEQIKLGHWTWKPEKEVWWLAKVLVRIKTYDLIVSPY